MRCFLADKITALGGELDINPSMPKKVRTAKEMMTIDIAAERQVIANYTRRIAQAEAYGDKGLIIRLEDMLAEGDRPRPRSWSGSGDSPVTPRR